MSKEMLSRPGENNWIGSVPSTWSVTRLSFRYSQQLGKMLSQDAVEGDEQQPYLGNKDVQWGRAVVDDLSTMTFSPAERAKCALRPGDLLVCEGGEVGRTAIWQCEVEPCYFQKAIHRLRPVDTSRDEPRFLFYCMVAATLGGHFEHGGNKSTISHLTGEALRAHRFPFPPLPTQRAIADFLDRKTAAIDALIEKKQKLLDLLAEKRAALINQAVTKGLDPDVPMKDSGVPWIGEIPAHWEVVPLRLYAKVVDCKHRTPEYIDEGFPIVSTTEVKPGRLDLAPVTRKVGVVDFRDMTENRTPTTGDIIYSRNASLGAAAYVDTDVPFAMGQDVVLITAPGADLLYLSYQLNSMVGMTQVDLACIGSTFKRINVGQIKQFQVCMPPSQEAERIASHLDRQEQRYDALRDRLERHVARLQEYRQALITAAVTGQIDVGGHGEQDGDTMGGERRRKLSSEGSL